MAASSGAYGYAADARLRLRPGPGSVAALNALGFVQRDPRENVSRDVTLGSPPDIRAAAELMLAALHEADGARLEGAPEVDAPRGGRPPSGCGAPTT